MAWRYQPVWIDEGDEQVYGLCEVYFDEERRLTQWTEDPFMVPQGASLDELTGDLVRMLVDAYSWKPVAMASLANGITFERAVSMEQRDALAKMVEATAHNFKEAAPAQLEAGETL